MLNYAKFFLLPMGCLLVYYLIQHWRYRQKGGVNGPPDDARPHENMIALLSVVGLVELIGVAFFPPARASAIMVIWFLIVTVPPVAIAGLVLGGFLPRKGRKGLLAHMLGGALFTAAAIGIIVLVQINLGTRIRRNPLVSILANWWLAIWLGSFLGLVYWTVRQTLVRRRLNRLNIVTDAAFNVRGKLILSAGLIVALAIGVAPYGKTLKQGFKKRAAMVERTAITPELQALQNEIAHYDIKGTFGEVSVTIPAMPNVSFNLNDDHSTRVNAGMFQYPLINRGDNKVPKAISEDVGEIAILYIGSFPKRCIFEIGIKMLCHQFKDQKKWCALRPEFADTLWCSKATKTQVYFMLKGYGWDSPQSYQNRAKGGWEPLYSLSRERIEQIKQVALQDHDINLATEIDDVSIECVRMNTRQSCFGAFAINDEVLVVLNLASLLNLQEGHVMARTEEAVERAFKYWAYIAEGSNP